MAGPVIGEDGIARCPWAVGENRPYHDDEWGRPVRGEEGAPKAVILCAADQDQISDEIARALNAKGYDVLRKSTPLQRSHSSMAIYDMRSHPERLDDLTRTVTKDLALQLEVLPFQQHATGGNAVVIWLGPDASR